MAWKYDADPGEREQVAWNMAAEQSRHISDLIKKAMKQMLNGNMGGCYWTLTGIGILIYPWLGKNEIKSFEDIESEINKYYNEWELWRKSVEEGKENINYRRGKAKFSFYTKRYFKKIMLLLRKLGYLPDKEDRSDLGF